MEPWVIFALGLSALYCLLAVFCLVLLGRVHALERRVSGLPSMISCPAVLSVTPQPGSQENEVSHA